MTAQERKTLITFLVENLRGGTQRCFGEKLTGTDRLTVIWAKRLFCTCIVDAREQFGLRTKPRTLQRLVRELRHIAFDELQTTLDKANDALLKSVADPPAETTFKALFHSAREEGALIEKCVYVLVLPLIASWFHSRNEVAFKLLRQVLTVLKQVGLTKVKRLKMVAFDNWYEIEANWSQVSSPDDPEAEILHEWFPVWYEREAFEGTLPHHGTGQIADRAHLDLGQGKTQYYEKYALLYHIPQLEQHMISLGFVDLSSPSSDMMAWMLPYDLMQNMRPNQWYDSCFVGWVPKSWKTFRTISEETACRMWWQQWVGEAVNNALRDVNEWDDEFGHHYSVMFQISEHYCITTEEWNRVLAKQGSENGSYATIDLSAASDTVGYKLVTNWFRKTWLYFWIVGTRSKRARYINPHEEGNVPNVVEQRKYAPMGSRLCFPIETFVFAAIAESVIRAITGKRSRPDDYKVFGDDIVIRVEFAAELIARLTELKFAVNTDKTFVKPIGDTFRESCGVEYLNGFDVKPIKLPKPFKGIPLGPGTSENPKVLCQESICAWIALANNFYELTTTRSLIIWALVDLHRVPVLFDDGTSGIKSSQPTNYHLPARYNLALQRWEVKAFHVEAKLKQVAIDAKTPAYKKAALASPSLERIRLFEYLSSTALRNRLLYPEDAYQAQVLDTYADQTGKLEWIPAPCGTTQFFDMNCAETPLDYLFNGEWYDHKTHSWRTWLTIK